MVGHLAWIMEVRKSGLPELWAVAGRQVFLRTISGCTTNSDSWSTLRVHTPPGDSRHPRRSPSGWSEIIDFLCSGLRYRLMLRF